MSDHYAAELRSAVGNLQAARQQRDAVIREAHEAGAMSFRAIAAIVHLSHQRVAQICATS